ncbi:hypothetical protein EV673_2470 [Limnobacter thiooxidans]|nr:hypothetical protein EV673_2470 [Limnobacter thiooxidans]
MTILIAIVYLCMFCAVAKMVAKQGRSIFFWVFCSVLVTPFTTAALLYFLRNREKVLVTRHDIDVSISTVDQRPPIEALKVNCVACRIPTRIYKLNCEHCGTEQGPPKNPHLSLLG